MNTSVQQSADCLIELGLEELPPKAMPALAEAFKAGMRDALANVNLEPAAIEVFAAPRRLAVLVTALPLRQQDSVEVLRGPPVKVAFDSDGAPTRAAQAFASKCGVGVDELERESTDKGEWLIHRASREGQPFSALAQSVIEASISQLPIPKRMRWGDSDESFVRPLHWLVAIHGDAVLPVTLFSIAAGNESRGHRFHAPEPFAINQPADYAKSLRERYVIADFEERRAAVRQGVNDAATALGGVVEDDEALYDEIAALVDWPVAVSGSFDARFLALPIEVLSSTLKLHQRYFPVLKTGSLEPTVHFITLSNIESKQPEAVRDGNQRVITPRLADAEFFWRNDQKQPLSSRRAALDQVVYQKQLGSLGDKTDRVAQLVRWLADAIGESPDAPVTAAQLSRCDLVTDMVGEFPDLQGVMGAYYAAAEGAAPDVVAAIRGFYQPRFAGDEIASGTAGRLLAIADKVDTLAGIFAIGKRPTGNRDPFGLRRAALGVIRTLIEGRIDIDLPALLTVAIEQQPVDVSEHPELVDDLYDFVIERLRHYEQQSLCQNQPDWFEAVAARTPHSLLDFHSRLESVAEFVKLPAAAALASANKRIANILRTAGTDANGQLDPSALKDPSEKALLTAWQSANADVAPAVESRDYTAVMTRLAQLREPVDQFFEDTMVMVDDVDLRRNRLSLLAAVRGLFLEVADVSELAVKGD